MSLNFKKFFHPFFDIKGIDPNNLNTQPYYRLTSLTRNLLRNDYGRGICNGTSI